VNSHCDPKAPQLFSLNFPVPYPGGVQVKAAVGQETLVMALLVFIKPIGPYPIWEDPMVTEKLVAPELRVIKA